MRLRPLLPTLALLTALASPLWAQPSRPLVFVPGLLGSRLCQADPAGGNEGTVVWGTLSAVRHFPMLAVDGTPDEIGPCGLIREVSFLGLYTQDLYAPLIQRLESEGYREGETLFVFDYDWRLSVFDNAARLAAFIDQTVAPDAEIDIVAHSMGGLIARIYALEHGGADRIGLFASAGTPWDGSVKLVEALETGWGSANFLVGGLDDFRRTLASFPSTFELMPRYEDCCAGGEDGQGTFEGDEPAAWTTLGWEGMEAVHLPDVEETETHLARLRRIASEPLPPSVDEAFLIGVDHRTPARYEVLPADGPAELVFTRSWAGDGTVLRDSATFGSRVTFATSFADHSAVLSDPQIQDFLAVALKEGSQAAVKAVPARERTRILTPLSVLVELIGVAIDTDQPAYQTGETARVTVHFRPDTAEQFAASRLRLTVTPPGEPAVAVPLTTDPAASDPSIPLEQSFSAEVETGPNPGYLALAVAMNGADGTPRVARRLIPILSP